MSISLDKKQALSILKVALYVGISAGLDFLISQTTDTQFGQLTPVINVVLVTVRKLFTTDSKGGAQLETPLRRK